MLQYLEPGGTFLLNSPHGPDAVWDHLPQPVQAHLIDKQAHLYVIDAYRVARDSGMHQRINTVMQVCFFAIAGVLPQDEAIAAIKRAIEQTYSKQGNEIVQMNINAVDQALAHLSPVPVPERAEGHLVMPPTVAPEAPEFVQQVTAAMLAGCGDALPVSLLPADGTYPSGTAKWEKRNIALEIPVWDPDVCIQCGKCAMVCPHSVIRIKVYDEQQLAGAPPSFKATGARDRAWQRQHYTIQVAPEHCTGCPTCDERGASRNGFRSTILADCVKPGRGLSDAIGWSARSCHVRSGRAQNPAVQHRSLARRTS